jgi:DNA-binding CsgD family transcriptional regulator
VYDHAVNPTKTNRGAKKASNKKSVTRHPGKKTSPASRAAAKRPGGKHGPVLMSYPDRAARRKKLRQAILAGGTPGDVADKFGVTRALVYSALDKGQVRKLTIGRRQQEYKKLAAMVKKGMRCKDVAKEAGVNVEVVYKACHANGVKLRHGWGDFSPEEKEAIVSKRPNAIHPKVWRELNWNLRDVDLAQQLGVSREAVRQHRMSLGKPKVSRKKRPGFFITVTA